MHAAVFLGGTILNVKACLLAATIKMGSRLGLLLTEAGLLVLSVMAVEESRGVTLVQSSVPC
jgi:hypothetical protein